MGDFMFKPKHVYYEENIKNYELGNILLDKFKDVPKTIIDSHNNIKELREKENKEFVNLKQYLIIGIRKTHKFVENKKVSDYLVPYTSSGCTAMCLYCYLVCNYNKCSYLRLFVNRDEIINKIIKVTNQSEKELTFEIGSNSDLILENTITNNLPWTINKFVKESKKGYLTFPTKFDMVDDLLSLDHKGKIIIRMSVNPKEVINKIELGTSSLEKRIIAINKLKKAGYKVGILIAPVVFIDNWREKYKELIEYLYTNLSEEVKKDVFFEVIFMTYSYVHKMINQDAFPKSPVLYSKEKMTGRGKGKYVYKNNLRIEGENYIKSLLEMYFKDNKIIYFS